MTRLLKATFVAGLIALALITNPTAQSPSYHRDGLNVVLDNLVTTSTDGVTLINTTPATVGVPVQMSPRLRWGGTAWDTDDSVSREVSYFVEALPTSGTFPSATWRMGVIIPGVGTVYPIEQTGNELILLTGLQLPASGGINFGTTRSRILAGVNGNVILSDSTGIHGMKLAFGNAAPTVATCGTGTISADSRNTSGTVTATGATACTVTFNNGATLWGNPPICTVTLRTAPTTTPYISAISTTAFTVSGLTAGNVFAYHCLGSF